jgi:hypothetical protein
MITNPKNKALAIIAIGAVMVIAALFEKWDLVNGIVIGMFAQMPTGQD